MNSVIEFIRLIDSQRSYYIHRLRHRARIHRAVQVGTHSRTHTELEWLRCRGEGTCLVRTKAILARQHHREAPTRSGCSAQTSCWHTEGDETRDSIGADSYGTNSIAVRVDVTLTEPLHLQEPAPRRR